MNSIIFIAACVFIWTGFIGAISFMESWLKFRAPNLTMPAGLSIGKLVFSALNKVEWAFVVIISITLVFDASKINSMLVFFFLIIVVILILQTAWLLPALNKRVKKVISGTTLPSSNLHYYYVSGEFIKLLLLVFLGGGLLKTII